MITDRDICVATYTEGKPIRQIPVSAVSSHHVWSVRPEDSIDMAVELMKRHRVRRLAVIDRGGNLVGALSLADIVRWSRANGRTDCAFEAEGVAATVADVLRPHCLVRPSSREADHGDAMQMSRSVIIPTAVPLRSTMGTTPQSCSHMIAAARSNVSVVRQT
jgi:CBS-domain-containing membrane protein